MRELKFRCWDSKIMRTDFALNADGDNRDLEYSDDFGVVTKGIVMQFTGLHDKNDKEIYEGDIVVFDEDTDGYTNAGELHEIKWTNGGWNGFHAVPIKYLYDKRYGEWCGGGEMWQFFPYETTIVGNIYENPDLLEIN